VLAIDGAQLTTCKQVKDTQYMKMSSQYK